MSVFRYDAAHQPPPPLAFANGPSPRGFPARQCISGGNPSAVRIRVYAVAGFLALIAACSRHVSSIKAPYATGDYSIDRALVRFAPAAAEERAEAVGGLNWGGRIDEFLRFEEKLPGFGGIFVHHDAVIAYGPRNLTADSVRSALSANASMFQLPPEHVRRLKVRGRVHVVPANFGFSYLIVWRSMLAALTRDAIPLSIDGDRNGITMTLIDTAAAAGIREQAVAAGIPREAVHFREGAVGCADPQYPSLRVQIRDSDGKPIAKGALVEVRDDRDSVERRQGTDTLTVYTYSGRGQFRLTVSKLGYHSVSASGKYEFVPGPCGFPKLVNVPIRLEPR